MRIVLDAMGTDNCPQPDVAGAVMAAKEFTDDVIILVGDAAQVNAELEKHNATTLTNIEVIHTDEHITMEDKPSTVIKGKPNSSMHVGLQLIKDGKADAFVTAGNTGAAMSISTMFAPKRIKSVRRPAMAAVGELNGHLITVLDIGANIDTKVDWLSQSAIMGNIYAEKVLSIKNPRVGLLSNGTEVSKGNQLVQEAYPIFQELPINFIGNVEPRGLLNGQVDVIVTDGYVGNILLKTYETAISGTFTLMRDELTRDLRAKIGAWLVKPYLKRVVKSMDPTQYGGAPLLGVDGVVIITHGGSTPQIIKDSIVQARKAVQADIIGKIKAGLEQ